jgi:hypothetical protein
MHEPVPQQVLRTGKSARDSPLCPAERSSGLVLRLPFQIAQNNRHSVLVGKEAQFFVEDSPQVNQLSLVSARGGYALDRN